MSSPKEPEEPTIEVLDVPSKNRRWRRYTAVEKRTFLEEAAHPGEQHLAGREGSTGSPRASCFGRSGSWRKALCPA